MRIQRVFLYAAIAATIIFSACGHGSVPIPPSSAPQQTTQSAVQTNGSVSAEPVTAKAVISHAVYMSAVPAEAPGALSGRTQALPLLVGTDPATWLARKIAAATNPRAPIDLAPLPEEAGTTIPPPTNALSFDGLADSPAICPPSGCTPPDMAIAVSPNAVLQFVNTSLAIYSPQGVLRIGFPKTAAAFFKIPSPGACGGGLPFTSDPRAFYDTKDRRFWVTILEVEGAFGVNACPLKSAYWVGVSRSSDPTGAWNVYSFDMRNGENAAADFTQTGLDGQGFYFGGNMFDRGGNNFLWDEIFAAGKAQMEAGQPVTPKGFKRVKIGGTLVDTLQPVLVEGRSSPAVALFVDTFNINSGAGNCFIPCTGINVVAIAKPLTSPALSSITVPTQQYTVAPLAFQPNGTEVMETFDTRISATPVYRNGSITMAIESGINNRDSVVPGVMWFQVAPSIAGGRVTAANIVQSGIAAFNGNRAASFGATMTDAAGNMLLVFDSMGPKLTPSIFSEFRQAGDPPGALHGLTLLKQGVTSLPGCGFSICRWGDFEAASYDGSGAARVWFASEYTNQDEDWNTRIGMRAL